MRTLRKVIDTYLKVFESGYKLISEINTNK
jgi:hypothetical protein